MSFNTERDNSGTIVVSPKNEKDQTGLVVLCHGLGDTAEGFADVAEMFASKMPYLKFILPTAPSQAVTMNMGMSMPSWYDIVGLSEKANENCKGIEESRQRLEDILKTEHENTGLPYSRMVLAGFSQGGALSLFTGMQRAGGAAEKLAGICILSGYLPSAKTFKITDGLHDTPILHCHGTIDPVVQFQMASKSYEVVTKEKGATNYTVKSYPIQHTVSVDEMAAVQSFLSGILPPDDTIQIKLKDPKTMSIKELKATIRKAGLLSKTAGFCEKSEYIKLVQDYRDGKF